MLETKPGAYGLQDTNGRTTLIYVYDKRDGLLEIASGPLNPAQGMFLSIHEITATRFLDGLLQRHTAHEAMKIVAWMSCLCGERGDWVVFVDVSPDVLEHFSNDEMEFFVRKEFAEQKFYKTKGSASITARIKRGHATDLHAIRSVGKEVAHHALEIQRALVENSAMPVVAKDRETWVLEGRMSKIRQL